MEDFTVLIIQVDQDNRDCRAGPCTGHAGIKEADHRANDSHGVEVE